MNGFIQRRTFLQFIAASGFSGGAARSAEAAGTILLRSGWQRINIGDVAHTLGMLALLRRYAPDARVIFWPADAGEDETAMIAADFPDVEIVYGSVGGDGKPASNELSRAWERADLFLHGSGPGVIAQRQMTAWRDG